jgi:hypothetical protein
MRSDTVRIYSIDGKGIMRWVSQDEAAVMRTETFWDGSLKFSYDSRREHGGRITEWLQMLPEPKVNSKPSDHNSPAAISAGEMIANSFMAKYLVCPVHGPACEGSGMARCEDQRPIRAAHSKVHWWPRPSADIRSVTVIPRAGLRLRLA